MSYRADNQEQGYHISRRTNSLIQWKQNKTAKPPRGGLFACSYTSEFSSIYQQMSDPQRPPKGKHWLPKQHCGLHLPRHIHLPQCNNQSARVYPLTETLRYHAANRHFRIQICRLPTQKRRIGINGHLHSRRICLNCR